MNPRNSLLILGLTILWSPACGGAEEQIPQKPIPTIPQDSAQGAAEAVLAAFANENAGAAWAMLPASYQQDLQSLVQQLPDKIPAELWNEAFALTQKAVAMVKTQKQYILGHPMLAPALEETDPKELEAVIDAAAGFMDVIANSEIATVDGLRGLDIEKFVRTTGQKALTQMVAVSRTMPDDPWAKLAQAKVEVVKSEGDKTTLRISIPGEDTVEEEYQKVEGKWIPTKLAEGWAGFVTEAKKGLAEMTGEMDPQTLMQAKMGMGMVGGMIEGMAKAESQEDFNKVTQMLSGLTGMGR